MPYDYENKETGVETETALSELSEDTPYLDKTEEDTAPSEKEDKKEDYESILKKNGRPKNKILSVLSLVIGIASLVISFFTVWGAIPALAAVMLAILSRKSLGYFDPISIVGIILGAFSAVFPVAFMLLEPLISSLYS